MNVDLDVLAGTSGDITAAGSGWLLLVLEGSFKIGDAISGIVCILNNRIINTVSN